ncbi:hypothetical protein ACH42_17035 [Endozoicomonas sp. (ex Bugula neritina AB1)]|nr:hypothetical protein ACH42_17035 [Endozoicomonas sp. (ex Bugula neritina AB1)]
MSYKVPEGNVDFTLEGAAYLTTTNAVVNFSGKPSLIFIPPPAVVFTTGSQWDTGYNQQRYLSCHHETSLPVQTYRQQNSHQARVLEAAQLQLFWNQVPKMESRVSFSHGIGQARSGQSSDQWTQAAAKENHQQSQWDDSIKPQDDHTGDAWNQPPERDSHINEGFQTVDLYGATRQKTSGYTLPQNPLNFVFREQEYTPNTQPAAWFSFGSIPPNPAIQPRDNHLNARFSSNQHQDEAIRLPWGFGQKARDEDVSSGYGGEAQPDITEKPEPQQPDIRESYLFMNTISAVVLPERTPIELPSIDISLDIDSFSWSLTGQLWGASSLAMIEPDQNGTKQIEVDINGWKWIFIIERYSTDRRFGNERYTIYGSSRSQLLAAPYAPLRSKSNTSNLNAKQAISEELANTGFSALYPDLNDYKTPDWVIPAGSYSYQNETPMKVIAKVAGTAGSVIIPSRDSDEISIQPRYPSSPWKWDSATMDKIIPAALVISLSANWRPEPEYNAVYVSGTHAGVAVNVKRAGTAGNEPAPDILEDWLTENQVNTERGRNELSKGGHQSITTLEIPLTDTSTPPGLIEPGQLVEVQDITGNWRGLCLSVGISASTGKVTQSIDLERHY